MTAAAPVELLPPNFQGSPPLCPVTRLPAFESLKALSAYFERFAPSIHITRRGKCEHCQLFHAATE